MPARLNKEGDRCYAQWGQSGKKYYYECTNKNAEKDALQKVIDQGSAAYASGYESKE